MLFLIIFAGVCISLYFFYSTERKRKDDKQRQHENRENRFEELLGRLRKAKERKE